MLDPRLFDDDEEPSHAPAWLSIALALLMGVALWGVIAFFTWLSGG